MRIAGVGLCVKRYVVFMLLFARWVVILFTRKCREKLKYHEELSVYKRPGRLYEHSKFGILVHALKINVPIKTDFQIKFDIFQITTNFTNR